MLSLSARLLHDDEFNFLSFITVLQNVNVTLLMYEQSLMMLKYEIILDIKYVENRKQYCYLCD